MGLGRPGPPSHLKGPQLCRLGWPESEAGRKPPGTFLPSWVGEDRKASGYKTSEPLFGHHPPPPPREHSQLGGRPVGLHTRAPRMHKDKVTPPSENGQRGGRHLTKVRGWSVGGQQT